MLDLSFLRKRKPKWRYPIGALLFHIAIVGALILLEIHFEREKIKEDLKKFLQIKTLSDDEFNRLILHNQVVSTEWVDPMDAAKMKNQKAYAGEKTQRVKKETRSRAKPTRKQMDELPLKTPLPGFGKKLKATEKSKVVKGSSQFLDPKLSYSPKTFLNTDEYAYSSIHNRVREAFAEVWLDNGERLFEKQRREKLSIPIGIYLTAVRYFFDTDGVISKVVIERSSGVSEYDKLAVDSIHKVAKINNPPPAFFKPPYDGSLRFEFYISLLPTGFYHSTVLPDESLDRAK